MRTGPYRSVVAWVVAVGAGLGITGCDAGGQRVGAYPHGEWRDGETLHYSDGQAYHVWVSTAPPYYNLAPGGYVATDQVTPTHFHKLVNPKGPAGQYIRCFAHEEDGRWVHQPQWLEREERKRRYER